MKEIKYEDLEWKETNYGYFRKILMAINNNSSKECRVQFIKVLPNKIIKPHYHKGQTESEYVLSGSGYVKSGGKIINLKPGTIFIVEPNEIHEVKAEKEGLLLFVTKANYSEDTEWRE